MTKILDDSLIFIGKAGNISEETFEEILKTLNDPHVTNDAKEAAWLFLEGKVQ